MKNIIFLFALIFSLFFPMSSFSNSNALDGGEIRFHGFVVSDVPKWLWRIASPEQEWILNIDEARKEDGKLVFDINNVKTLPFFEGYLQDIAERGGPGLTPTITYSSEGVMLNREYGNHLGEVLSIPVRDYHSNYVVGKLSFIIEEGMAISTGNLKDDKIPRGVSLILLDKHKLYINTPSQKLMERLSMLLSLSQKKQGDFFTHYNGKVFDIDILSDSRVVNFIAAYASFLSGFKLYISSDYLPSKWRASLTITVTVN